jgi:diguanylate cyclase (GGDEF)-like protein
MSNSGSFLIELQELRDAHASRIARLVEEIQSAWSLLRGNPNEIEAARRLHRLALELAEPAGSFGYAGVRAHVHQIEIALAGFLEGAGRVDADVLRTIDDSVHALVIIVAKSVQARTTNGTRRALGRGEQQTRRAQPTKLVQVCHSGADAAYRLERLLQANGYAVEILASARGLEAALGKGPPDVLITDLEFAERPETRELVERIVSAADPIPWVCLSNRTGIDARLCAVRAGCSAFFGEPLDEDALVDKLGALIGRGVHDPYRVLIVENENAISSHYAGALRRAGIIVSAQTNPLQVIASLTEDRPDLVLMEVQLRGCTGVELASILRQEDAYLSTPILFVSCDEAVDLARNAKRIESEDCLRGAIEPDGLVAAVQSRLRRARAMRSLMTHDGLTGLLNRAAMIQRIDVEIARARRRDVPLAFAMIDVDFFKKVNDVFGHPAGDQVLRTLARFLQQRLRHIDVIGRYGGEEFAIIFPDTQASSAARALDAVREAFRRLTHPAAAHDTSITFSAGIAGFPSHRETSALVVAADLALYDAKRSGRNRVVVREPN